MLIDAGMMGFPYSDLDLISEYEFNLYRVGYQQREISFWERSRFESWVTLASQTSNPPDLHKLLPLPGDEEKKTKRTKPIAKVSKAVQKDAFKHLGLSWPEESGQQI